MMDAVPAPTEPPAPATPQATPFPEPAASELAAAELMGSAAIAHDAGTTSALESLFSEENFRDYEAEPGESQAPFARSRSEEPAPRPAARGEVTRAQKILLGVAGGLVVLLALFALFLLGTRLSALIGPAAPASPSTSPSPSPSATVAPVGPVAPGVWAWDALLGGECLDPFESPWAEKFTVVDCASPHPAQLVYRGTFPTTEGTDPASAPFPGTQALQAQLSVLCTAAGVVDLAAAGQYTDVQFQGSYPATQAQWDAGNRNYYCFVSRSSGEPLTGSLAVPAPAPTEAPAG